MQSKMVEESNKLEVVMLCNLMLVERDWVESIHCLRLMQANIPCRLNLRVLTSGSMKT